MTMKRTQLLPFGILLCTLFILAFVVAGCGEDGQPFGTDAGTDTGAGVDAGIDAGIDAETDAGPDDPVCGDDACEAPEDCASCEDDCGPCGPVCGDDFCEAPEDCDSCELDCGPCGPVCGDDFCEAPEDCDSCELDCGPCGPVCGDDFCEAPEDCTSCELDCGPCSPLCGDNFCSAEENPWHCSTDCGQPAMPADFSGVVWLHTNVSGWEQTANLSSITVGGGSICLPYDKTEVWYGLDHVGAFVNANPWIFIYQDGVLYAATWEWMRFGQTCKNASSVAGDHIKQDPLWGFAPQSGHWYGFMVSGLARDGTRNVLERSNVQLYQWP